MTERTILAIDFDGTIADTKFPIIKGEMKDAKKYVNKLYDLGYYIIVWTCRNGIDALTAEDWLLRQGIKFHKVNGSEPRGIMNFSDNLESTRKVYAHCYIDNLNLGGFIPWDEAYEWVINNVKINKLD